MTESNEAEPAANTEPAPAATGAQSDLPTDRDTVATLLTDRELALSAAFRAWDITRDRLESVARRAVSGMGQRPYAEVRRASNDGLRAQLEEAYAVARMILCVQLFADVSDVPTGELLLSGFHAHYEENWGPELATHVRRAYEGLLVNCTTTAREVRERARDRKAQEAESKRLGLPTVSGPNAFDVDRLTQQ